MKLDTMKPMGNGINAPVVGGSEKSKMMDVSLNYDGGINAMASTANLSAKFKNPQVKQSVDPSTKYTGQ